MNFPCFRIEVPGDKSISHRALILGAIAEGETVIHGLSQGEDVKSTRRCLEMLGVEMKEISHSDGRAPSLIIQGRGKAGLQAPQDVLDCGNSGTTLRLLSGLLAGQSFPSVLTGDSSLIRRPMKRLVDPLRKMGAKIDLSEGDFAPVSIAGMQDRPLRGLDHFLEVPSAQIKSALLLAGLFAKGRTSLQGRILSRDHTERMLPCFGVNLAIGDQISIDGASFLSGTELHVPGDPSSAAFWVAAACLIPGSEVMIHTVSLNPTRLGFIKVFKRMGAQIETQVISEIPEPYGTIRVRWSPLRGTRIEPDEISSLVDEIPIIAVVASQAEGWTEIRGASELRIKESDRIEAISQGFQAMGVPLSSQNFKVYPDGLAIKGPQRLKGGRVNSLGDHRIAMSFAIAGLIAKGEMEITESDCVSISYPHFFQAFKEFKQIYGVN